MKTKNQRDEKKDDLKQDKDKTKEKTVTVVKEIAAVAVASSATPTPSSSFTESNKKREFVPNFVAMRCTCGSLLQKYATEYWLQRQKGKCVLAALNQCGLPQGDICGNLDHDNKKGDSKKTTTNHQPVYEKKIGGRSVCCRSKIIATVSHFVNDTVIQNYKQLEHKIFRVQYTIPPPSPPPISLALHRPSAATSASSSASSAITAAALAMDVQD